MTAISDIHDSLSQYRHQTPEYIEKMMHKLPDGPVLDREAFIVRYCKSRHVLNLGSMSGELHECIKAVAASCYGVDKKEGADIVRDLDIDPPLQIPDLEFPHTFNHMCQRDLIVAGEVLEHLGNPGNLIRCLRRLNCELLVTVPNAFTLAGLKHIQRGYENVNKDHVAWYSPKTLKTLLERYGFTITYFAWYNGKPGTAEGIIVIAR